MRRGLCASRSRRRHSPRRTPRRDRCHGEGVGRDFRSPASHASRSPVIADYANADPSALWQAAGANAAFVAGCGAYGYATRRDLSSWARTLCWALLGLIAFGIVSIPNSNLIYAIAGLGIFGAFTIFDFNRLRRADAERAVVIAASIFLDIFNVFLLALGLFGGQRE
jgi:FtsH-binding integral membrane protein